MSESFYKDQHLTLLAGGIPTETLNVIEGESIYLRLTNSFGGDMNCDAFYPDGVTEVIASGSSMYSPNHWGRKGNSA